MGLTWARKILSLSAIFWVLSARAAASDPFSLDPNISSQGIVFSSLEPRPGSRLTVVHSVKSNAALSGLKMQFLIYKVSGDRDHLGPLLHMLTLENQSFAPGEARSFSNTFTIPTGTLQGNYVYIVKVTSEDGQRTYLNMDSIAESNTFSVRGKKKASLFTYTLN